MKNKKKYLVLGLSTLTLVAFLFGLYAFFGFQRSGSVVEGQSVQLAKAKSLQFTPFDRELARQFQDKDNDGRCDLCGMPVDICIDSGQIQCNIDPGSTIGILGSAHIHADFKVFVDGKPLDFASRDNYLKSSFIHLEENQNKEEASGVLHINATGVPLWIFFKSLGIDFTSTCLTLQGREFCQDSGKQLRFFVNGVENDQFGNHVVKDLDKILITYGNEGEAIQEHIKQITDFAKNH